MLRNCDYATFIVDHLLDILTGNEHGKTSKYVEEQKKLRREDALLDSTAQGIDDNNQQQASTVDFAALKSLSQDGIDMSFLDSLKTTYENPVKQEVSNGLTFFG